MRYFLTLYSDKLSANFRPVSLFLPPRMQGGDRDCSAAGIEAKYCAGRSLAKPRNPASCEGDEVLRGAESALADGSAGAVQ